MLMFCLKNYITFETKRGGDIKLIERGGAFSFGWAEVIIYINIDYRGEEDGKE